MAEENENLQNEGQKEESGMTGEEYVKALKDLKEKTVSKELYEKLEKDNQTLIEALKTQNPIVAKPEEKEKVNIRELATDIINNGKDMDFLEGIEKTLKLRDAMIDQMKVDPFLPTGHQVEITDEMRAKADKAAKIYRECVDFAKGDPNIFTAELQRRMEDVSFPRRK